MNVERSHLRVLAILLVVGSSLGMSGCSNALFVDSADVTNGAIDGFSTGMSKEQALNLAQQKDVFSIRPILPAKPSIDFSDTSRLTSPEDGRALELVDEHGGKVVFTFGDGHVINVQAEGNLVSTWKDCLGISAEQLAGSLRSALKGNHELSVSEVVNSDNRAWIDIKHLSPGTHSAINAYNTWSFETPDVKPVGAQFVLYFSEGTLARISYKRPRIHIE